uniref:Cytochrome b5 heme-binding domain-containing protein n=1 Tax=Spongospora subterranea TaxID=70186 RepID=A0A0H5R0B3_9EUKA|eukprot:CRZ01229.1 hypothetical protein [Spongospora subterranea]
MSSRRIGPRELADHRQDVWVAIHDHVYDLGAFNEHPGGLEIIRYSAGKDASKEFDETGHSKYAKKLMANFLIGIFLHEDDPSYGQPPTDVDVSDVDVNVVDDAVPNPVPASHQRHSGLQKLKPFSARNSSSPIPPVPAFQSTSSLTGEIHKRPKQPLSSGHSAMDWLRLTNQMAPRQLSAYTLDQVAEHCHPLDTWIAHRGFVYNVTEYLDFHPGGRSELMRAAGKDATALFDATHPWVNASFLLGKCCVGKLTV